MPSAEMFSLCTLPYLFLCLDCPRFCLLSLQYNTDNTNTYARGGIQTRNPSRRATTDIPPRSRRHRDRPVLCLYFFHTCLLYRSSWLVPLSLLYNIKHKHPCPWRDSNPQSQQASALVGAATLMGRIESAAFRLIAH
jgi:hypothetical protein